MKRKLPEPLDLRPSRGLSIRDRAHKTTLESFREPAPPHASVAQLLESLPDFLGARSLRELASVISASHRQGRHVVAAMGGHVVKVGCGPVMIDLMERGIVTALAVNGAFAIHDYEIALEGGTSEYVDETIRDGSFGWAREPAEGFALACRRAVREGIGLGRSMALDAEKLPYARYSVLAACARLDVPITVHVAIGTDTVHMHPSFSGAEAGEASHIDFRIAAQIATELEGGVWINIGSAVVMPEVFLKLVSIARNHGHRIDNVVSANLDMQRHYRTGANVIGRPVSRGIELIGHHEIILPLLRQAVLAALENESNRQPT